MATFDPDYGELVFKRGLPTPPLIVLQRVTSYQPAEPADWLSQLNAEQQFQEEHFHIYDGGAVRRRAMQAGLSGGRP